jgi:hypothetical protein
MPRLAPTATTTLGKRMRSLMTERMSGIGSTTAMIKGRNPGVIKLWEDTQSGDSYRVVWTGTKVEVQQGKSDFGLDPDHWWAINSEAAMEQMAEWMAQH